MDEEDHRGLLDELGQESASKREGDLMDFIHQQQSNDGRGGEDDDWDDALALRSFLKLPKHAKEKLTQSSGEPTSVFSDGSHHDSEVHGHRRETAVGHLSSQFGLGDAMLDGKAWHEDESVKSVGLKMDQHRHADSSSGSLAIDLFANSELTTEHIEDKPTVDEFGVPMEVYEQEEEDGLSSGEVGAFSGSSSFESVAIPNSVTTIGDSECTGCSDLESVILGNGVTRIGNNAFSGCSRLRSVELVNFRFQRCLKESVEMGSGVAV